MKSENQEHEKIIKEVAALRKRNKTLEKLELKHRLMEKNLAKQSHALQERIKEINCLYSISKLIEKPKISLDNIYQNIVDLIPFSWQYPDITCARLTISGKKIKTKNFKETPWQQCADVVVYNKISGQLVVCYLEEKPDFHEGPFLKEERALINAIAERLGRTTEQKRAEKALHESEKKLKKQNILLQKKNLALKEIINQVTLEKKSQENRMLNNANELLLPLLKKLKNKGSQIDKNYIQLLENNIETLTSPFGSRLLQMTPKLTPREVEICNMIRSGLTSKEIAGLLNITYRSVETYRNYIRKKLGLINQKVNLTSYLINMQKM